MRCTYDLKLVNGMLCWVIMHVAWRETLRKERPHSTVMCGKMRQGAQTGECCTDVGASFCLINSVVPQVRSTRGAVRGEGPPVLVDYTSVL